MKPDKKLTDHQQALLNNAVTLTENQISAARGVCERQGIAASGDLVSAVARVIATNYLAEVLTHKS